MSTGKRQIVLTSTVATILIIGIGLGIYSISGHGAGITSSSTQNNAPSNYPISGAGNLTALATYVSTFTAPTSIFSTIGSPSSSTSTTAASSSTSSTSHSNNAVTTSSSSSSSYSFTPNGSFTYSPSSPVKILTVKAFASQLQNNESVDFSVEFQNAGNSTIYVVGGGGSSLSSSIVSGPVQIQYTQVKCEIASAKIPVDSGQSYTSTTPGCWSGFEYVLTQPGTVVARLTLNWSASSSGAQQEGVTVITAEFSFS